MPTFVKESFSTGCRCNHDTINTHQEFVRQYVREFVNLWTYIIWWYHRHTPRVCETICERVRDSLWADSNVRESLCVRPCVTRDNACDIVWHCLSVREVVTLCEQTLSLGVLHWVYIIWWYHQHTPKVRETMCERVRDCSWADTSTGCPPTEFVIPIIKVTGAVSAVVCMYVCMYACMYTYMYTYMYAYMYARLSVCVYIYVYA